MTSDHRDPERTLGPLSDPEASLSEARWQRLLENSPFGVVVYNPDGSVKYANQKLQEMFELTEEESEFAIANYNILQDPHLDSNGTVEYVRAAFAGEPALIPRIEYELETPIARKRVRLWIEGVIYPVHDEQGNLQEVVSIQQNISSLMKTQQELGRSRDSLVDSVEELSQIYASAPVGLALMDTDLRCVRVNEAMAKFNGMSCEEHIGKTMHEIAPHVADEIEARYREVLDNGVAEAGVELRAPAACDLSVDRDWLLSYLPVMGRDGTVHGVSAVVQDVTEQKKLEAERRDLEAKVQHAQKLESLGVLAGGIAHDFNNLLIGVLGNAELSLSSLEDDSPGRKYVERIRIAAERAGELTNQLLAYSGKGQFVVGPVNLNQLVREMKDLLGTVTSKKVRLEFDLGEALPPIQADATQIRQVVMNLITNASEAVGEEEGEVRIRTRLASMARQSLDAFQHSEPLTPGDYVRLDVSDTGSGMDEETLAKIFDPFFSTKFTGRGLGLAAVQGIVRGHRAAIRIESEVGRGSRVTILYPPAASKPATPRPERKPAPLDMRSRTILVVDDEAVVRDVTRAMLERLGFRVLTAGDGHDGVEVFRRHCGDVELVLLDMTMPGLDGLQAMRKMREIQPEIRVLLASGYSEQVAADKFGGEQLSGFLQKPFSASALQESLEGAFSRG